MKTVHIVAFVLAMVGALNWGLVGVGQLSNSNLNLVNMLLGSWPVLESVVYVLVGLSAVYLIATHNKECRNCASTTTPSL